MTKSVFEREVIERCAAVCDAAVVEHMNKAGYFKDTNGKWCLHDMRHLQPWQYRECDSHVAKSNEALALAVAIRALAT